MVGANMLCKDDILGAQINSVLSTLINFCKFIAGDKKWVLYAIIQKEENRDFGQYRHRPRNQIHAKKVLVCKSKVTELICTSNT